MFYTLRSSSKCRIGKGLCIHLNEELEANEEECYTNVGAIEFTIRRNVNNFVNKENALIG